MDRTAARELVRETLERAFDRARFTAFTVELLNDLDASKAFKSLQGQYIPEKFREFVQKYERIGQYTDPEGRKLDVLVVYLQRETSRDRARTAQRGFVARYLRERGEKEAALVAFVPHDQPEDWRFSCVRMRYELGETPTGRVSAREVLTPATRYSFLVGEHERSHTAQGRLEPLLIAEDHNPSLEDIESAFSVEPVTKEFYEQYRLLYRSIAGALDDVVRSDAAVHADFAAKGIIVKDFAKKLLGQIVFLYFLQKKGWFGVARAGKWGDGSKRFMRDLAERRVVSYSNFFDEVLEPLFYEALATERTRDYFAQFNCRIPFLNGGLFEPLNGYDWVGTTITLPNELFTNAEESGIFDVFDRYNFTVREDEPLEREVAIDPEMLGKVFENLLGEEEVEDRRRTGTYYTPRNIVHFMCRESIKEYLAERCSDVSREDIAILLAYGDDIVEHDARVERVGKETETYAYRMPDAVRVHAEVIDAALERVRICDPAIGSGAFPVGIMHEVVRARQALSTYCNGGALRPAYDLKRHTIQESLYGVDIEASAVEIAKLRLWLSLIVDEDDYDRIQPLPNLDYKIMQGNSLLESFEGVSLFDKSLLLRADDIRPELDNLQNQQRLLTKELQRLDVAGKLTEEIRKASIRAANHLDRQMKIREAQQHDAHTSSLFSEQNERMRKWEELKAAYRKYCSATQGRAKTALRKRIALLEREFIEATLRDRGHLDLLPLYDQSMQKGRREFFLWPLYFADVFDGGGFDIVIANPPYVRHERIVGKEQLKAYEVYSGTADLYCYFYALAHRILRDGGVLTFITSNKYLRAGYGRKVRMFLKQHMMLRTLVDFGDLPVFAATAYPSILIARKQQLHLSLRGVRDEAISRQPHTFRGCTIATENELSQFERVLNQKCIPMQQDALPNEDGWNIETPDTAALKRKIEGTPENTKSLKDYVDGKILYGIKTGYNDAFVIDAATRDRLIKEDPKSAEVIKPFLRGQDIKRYDIEDPGLYLIDIPNGWTDKMRGDEKAETFFRRQFPAVFAHLSPFRKKVNPKGGRTLENRDDQGRYWWELRPCKYDQEFEKPKIISARFMAEPLFGYDTAGAYTNDACYIIPTDDLYLYGVINSRLGWFYLQQKCCSVQNSYSQVHIQFLSQVPIRIPSDKHREAIEQRVRKILTAKKRGLDAAAIEREVDQLVYEVYGLTDEEIKLIEIL